MAEEMISSIDGSGVNHVLLSRTEAGWQASIGQKGNSGYTVEQGADPASVLFAALHRVGVVTGPTWVHPNPFVRLENALDRSIIARWSR